MNSNPEYWFRRKVEPLYRQATKEAAQFVGCDSSDLVFVQNATTGMNTVLKSLSLKPGECILATNTTYNSVKRTCEHLVHYNTENRIVTIEFELPIHNEDYIITKYKEVISSNPHIKIAVIDHITSPTAVVMPVKRIAELCRAHGIYTLVDGAHAPGQLDLNIEDLNVDFYTANFHKWMFTPRGCAILYISKKQCDWVKPLVTTRNYLLGIYPEFGYQGTRDDTPYTVVPQALDFFRQMGGLHRIRDYNSNLLDQAVELLLSIDGVQKFPIPAAIEAPYMRLLILPPIPGYETTEDGAIKLNRDVADKYNTVILTVAIFNQLVLRISAQIFNTLEDYKRLHQILQELLNK